MDLKKEITFVSFCVDIGRDNENFPERIRRQFAMYERGMLENIDSVFPLILFTSVKNIELPPHRNNTNLKIEYFDTSSIEKEFPNFARFDEQYKKLHEKLDEIEKYVYYYNPLVVLKLKKIIDVIKSNPFDTDYFFWIDCYLGRGMSDESSKFFYDDVSHIKKCKNIIEKSEDKFIYFSGTQPFGFFWGGKKEALLNVYVKYFDKYFEKIEKEIITEELIFQELEKENPELFKKIDIHSYGAKYKKGLMDYFNLYDDSL